MTLISAHSGLSRKLVTLTEERTLLQVPPPTAFRNRSRETRLLTEDYFGAGEGT